MNTGERSAVGSKSGKPVHQSGPGLRRPTPAITAGRNPAARPTPPQPKTGPGCGVGNPATPREREALALDTFDGSSIRQLIEFFELLDQWNREAHAH